MRRDKLTIAYDREVLGLPEGYVEIGDLAPRRYETDDQTRIGIYLGSLGVAVESRTERVVSPSGDRDRQIRYIPAWVEIVRHMTPTSGSTVVERAFLAGLRDVELQAVVMTVYALGGKDAVGTLIRERFGYHVAGPSRGLLVP